MQQFLIIGGGIIGMLSARELALAGASTTLIEMGRTGQESSWAGGGILSPLHPWRYPEPVNALATWSQRHYPELVGELAADTGIDAEWSQSGLLVLDDGEQAQALDWGTRWSQPVEAIDRSEVAQLEPAIGDPPPGGLWLPRVAQVRNPRLVKALRADLQHRGVHLVEETRIERLLIRNGRVAGVTTANGEIAGDRVLVCTGAWSGQLLQELGLALPVQPVLGQMILFRTTPGTLTRITLCESRYSIPRRDGRILFGSTLEHIGFDKRTTSEARDALRRAARSLFPVLARTPIERHWAGLRPGSPDGIPFIGSHPEIGGLYVNTGHFRPPLLPPEPYRLARSGQ